jgi:DNA-binding MarR family transcriptional regulator
LKKELIFVVEDPRDSRKKVLGITMAGKTALKNFENGIERLITKVGDHSRVWSDVWQSSPLFEAKV